MKQIHEAGADLGGGGADASSSGIRPPADPKGPPFDTSSKIHFWPTDPKIFLKVPSAPIYTNFEGERAPEKNDFPKNFQKVRKNAFFALFFQNFDCSAENFAKIGAKQCFGRARKINQFGRPKKKKVVKIFDFFFENPPPPSRKS